MSDINRSERRIIFPRFIAAGLILGMAVYLSLMFVILFGDLSVETSLSLFKTALVLACSLGAISIVLLVVVSKYISERSGEKFRIQEALSIAFLTIFGFLSLPTLQTRLNNLNAERALSR